MVDDAILTTIFVSNVVFDGDSLVYQTLCTISSGWVNSGLTRDGFLGKLYIFVVIDIFSQKWLFKISTEENTASLRPNGVVSHLHHK